MQTFDHELVGAGEDMQLTLKAERDKVVQLTLKAERDKVVQLTLKAQISEDVVQVMFGSGIQRRHPQMHPLPLIFWQSFRTQCQSLWCDISFRLFSTVSYQHLRT